MHMQVSHIQLSGPTYLCNLSICYIICRFLIWFLFNVKGFQLNTKHLGPAAVHILTFMLALGLRKILKRWVTDKIIILAKNRRTGNAVIVDNLVYFITPEICKYLNTICEVLVYNFHACFWLKWNDYLLQLLLF